MARPARVDDAVPDVPAVLSGRVVRLMIVPPVHIFTIAAKRGDAMALDIEEPIATEEDLRAILPRWPGNASRKDLDRLNDVARAFIARTPYLVISSVGADGRHDISPKGDARGFVQVHDDKTLIIPDRLGDHRLDTFENLIADPRLGLFFLIPDHTETLRIAGTGRIARDQSLRTAFAVNGRLPELVLVATVEQVFMHCSKSVVRSQLWSPEHWRDTTDAPTLAQWFKGAVDTDQTLDDVQAVHDNDRLTRLYLRSCAPKHLIADTEPSTTLAEVYWD